MAKDFTTLEDSNRSTNPSIHEVSNPERRQWLQGSTAWLASYTGILPGAASLGGAAILSGCATPSVPTTNPFGPPTPLGFAAIGPSTDDALRVPAGYTHQVLAPWGEPIGVPGAMPAFRWDASNSAADQAVQMGMHHDGLQYYPLTDDGQALATDGRQGNRRGLLAMNHEYTDEALLHPDGLGAGSAEKTLKSQHAHGLAVIEVALQDDGQWTMVRPSQRARRVTMRTPFRIAGPAAGHALMKTAADPAGLTVLGTLSNCASGKTPWGTYLSGEENWAGYFRGPDQPDEHTRRWGIRANGGWNRWWQHDERFDARKHPHEPNRFGWVVELDPMDPTSTPVKRTALGRAAHEGAWVAVTRSGKAVVYSGEDAVFEYLYKFVSRDAIRPVGQGLTAAQANRDLLDHGTLYVARFDSDGTGRWLPLVHGQGPLTAANGFADAGDVVIKARQAADLLGATKMDRPEWLTIDPRSRWVYCTLTNNTARGTDGKPGPDASNPRARNAMGQIIRWLEDGDHDGERMVWNHLLLAGDPQAERPEARGTVRGDAFACPDGLAFDARGVLWIQTDVGPANLNRGEYQRLGNNQLLACDVSTGEVRRFLTGPRQCEVTGLAWTPDGQTMFLNIQHPGEGQPERNTPDQPRRYSNWPDFKPDGRPRSSTVVIRKQGGGVVGA